MTGTTIQSTANEVLLQEWGPDSSPKEIGGRLSWATVLALLPQVCPSPTSAETLTTALVLVS